MRTHFLAWGPCLLAALSFALPHVARADNAGPQYDPTSTAIRSLLVDSAGTPYVAGSGVPVAGPVDQASAGSAAQAWYVRQAPGGANMSATNPLLVQLSDGTAVYAGPTSTQLPAALVGGRLSVDGSGVTQPVSAASLPLPTGAATEGTLSTIDGKLPGTVAADRTTAGAPAAVRLSDGTSFIGAAAAPVRTDPTGTTAQPVTDNGGSLTVDGSVSVSGTVTVDGSGVTQPVSGTVTANAGTGTFAVSAATLPLPSGAATAAKQPALGTAGTASADVITIQGIASMTPVTISGTVTSSEAGATVVGTSSTITCDTTAVVVDDTSVANTSIRKVELCNPSTNTASIYATGSGGTGGSEVLPGACYELLLAASSTPLYCYAASAVSATALETR